MFVCFGCCLSTSPFQLQSFVLHTRNWFLLGHIMPAQEKETLRRQIVEFGTYFFLPTAAPTAVAVCCTDLKPAL